MSPIDGPIGLVPETNLAFTTDVNISEAQPSKAKGLGGDSGQRTKNPTILYKYRYTLRWIDNEHNGVPSS